MKAVKFDHYGDIDVLEVRDVPLPSPVLARCRLRSRRPESTQARQ
jgi:hypothetical protein